jgi:hypothetical protein
LRETPYQANRAASMLSKLFNLAEDWGLRQAGSNPARRIKKFREEEKKRYLWDEEQTKLGEVLANALTVSATETESAKHARTQNKS